MKRTVSLFATVLFLASCTGDGAGPEPSGRALPVAELKLRILDAVHHRIDYCDPDVYPVAFGSALDAAKRRLPEIRKARTAYRAILRHENIDPHHQTNQDLLRINDDYKKMQVLQLDPEGDGYRFSVTVGLQSDPTKQEESLSGTVSRDGRVDVQVNRPSLPVNCPICLVPGARISTPRGDVAVADVQVGMTVWSTDLAGRRIRATVLRTLGLAATGFVDQIRLADGRSILVSPGHPTADGRLIGGLRIGARLAGSMVTDIDSIPYRGWTYDLLPSGPTGTYFADAVLLGSTLRLR